MKKRLPKEVLKFLSEIGKKGGSKTAATHDMGSFRRGKKKLSPMPAGMRLEDL